MGCNSMPTLTRPIGYDTLRQVFVQVLIIAGAACAPAVHATMQETTPGYPRASQAWRHNIAQLYLGRPRSDVASLVLETWIGPNERVFVRRIVRDADGTEWRDAGTIDLVEAPPGSYSLYTVTERPVRVDARNYRMTETAETRVPWLAESQRAYAPLPDRVHLLPDSVLSIVRSRERGEVTITLPDGSTLPDRPSRSPWLSWDPSPAVSRHFSVLEGSGMLRSDERGNVLGMRISRWTSHVVGHSLQAAIETAIGTGGDCVPDGDLIRCTYGLVVYRSELEQRAGRAETIPKQRLLVLHYDRSGLVLRITEPPPS
jgi:hypothetical protein